MSRHFDSMPKKVFTLTFIILMFMPLFVGVLCLDVNALSTNDPQVGVKVGDWIEYDINWTTTPAYAYPVATRREILDVKGTVLTINTTYELSTGTFTSNVTDGDVVNGSGSCALVFIPANLGVGDIVYIQGFEDVTKRIDSETTRTYLGVARTVIHAEFVSHGVDISIYWDKETGVALEINAVGTYSSISVIRGTNMWSSNGGSTDGLRVLIFSIIMISLVSVLVYGYMNSQRKGRKRKKRSHR